MSDSHTIVTSMATYHNMGRTGTQKWQFLIFYKKYRKSDNFDAIFPLGFCMEP
jgi:hypothetical protein